MTPPPPLIETAEGWWFHTDGAERRGPFTTRGDALWACEIYADCVLHKRDILTFSTMRYRFLSNFWLVQVDFDGVLYRSTEHAFQAAKTLVHEEREQIRTAYSPGAAKGLGRRVHLREDWEHIKINVMYELLVQKFHTEPLRLWLPQTGDVALVEGNTWGDAFWGITGNGTGEGRNELGKLLVRVRAELREESDTCPP